ATPRTISRASPITPAFREADDAAPFKVANRLTRSDIKFRTPAPKPGKVLPLDLDPDTLNAPALEPPALALSTRAMPQSIALELDDDLSDDEAASEAAFELGATAIARDLAIHSARSAPSPPEVFGDDSALDLDGLGPPVSEQRTFAPASIAMQTIPSGLHPIPRTARPAHVPAFVPIAPPAPVDITPTLPPAMRALIVQATERGASDLHLIVGRPPCVRVLGELVPLRPETLDARAVDALVMPLLDHRGHTQLAAVGYSDFAIEVPGGGRMRSNVARCQGGLRGTFRIARAVPPTLDELGLPKELAKVIAHHQGLVVIAGPSGHGKTTTLAALVDLINSAAAFHIITVEDPIEIVYPRKAAVVSQREVGPHTRSFAAALKGSLREDPDVIVIGELRDRETVEIALTAAETGHLVLATMSTPSAAKTIDRLVDMFPPDDQQQVRSSIAGALRAIVSQRLLPAASGTGVVPAVELLTGVLPLANMIRDDKLFQLPNLMQRGRSFGMIRFDDSLIELVRSGKITSDAALAVAENRKELTAQLGAGKR
nr:PilT/PilU family type 4a pilus ATPase [Deltaproteobacteria bacterium]